MTSATVSSEGLQPLLRGMPRLDVVPAAANATAAPPSVRRRVARMLENGVILLLLVYLVPVVILVVGAPFALFARLILEILERL